MISKIEDFDNLPVLNTLHIRDNKLENLDGFSENLKALQYINLRFSNVIKLMDCNILILLIRGNAVTEYVQVKKLQQLVKLRALVLAGKTIENKLFFYN